MAIRREIRDLIDAGKLPSEDAEEEVIAERERLLELIVAPVTDGEAQRLVSAFGDDDCYGLSWTLLHLIETAPGAQIAKYPDSTGNSWIELLNARVEAARQARSESEI